MSHRDHVPESSAPEPDVPRYARLPLLGAWAKFSVKLFLDSLLDVVLMPAAFAAVALGILRGGDEPDRYFRALMRFGRRAEHFVNLFGNPKAGSVDDVLGDAEQHVATAFERRGWSRKAEAVLRIPDLSTPPAARPQADTPPPAPAVDTAPREADAANAATSIAPPPPPPPPAPLPSARDGNEGPPRDPT